MFAISRIILLKLLWNSSTVSCFKSIILFRESWRWDGSFPCNYPVTERVKSKIELVKAEVAINPEEAINLQKDYAFVEVSLLQILPSLTLMDSKQSTIELKRPSNPSNPVTYATHLVRQEFFDFFFKQSEAWFSERPSIFDMAHKN